MEGLWRILKIPKKVACSATVEGERLHLPTDGGSIILTKGERDESSTDGLKGGFSN